MKPDPKAHSLDVRLRDGYEDGSYLPERRLQASFRLKSFKEKEVKLGNVFMEITKGVTN